MPCAQAGWTPLEHPNLPSSLAKSGVLSWTSTRVAGPAPLAGEVFPWTVASPDQTDHCSCTGQAWTELAIWLETQTALGLRHQASRASTFLRRTLTSRSITSQLIPLQLQRIAVSATNPRLPVIPITRSRAACREGGSLSSVGRDSYSPAPGSVPQPWGHVPRHEGVVTVKTRQPQLWPNTVHSGVPGPQATGTVASPCTLTAAPR